MKHTVALRSLAGKVLIVLLASTTLAACTIPYGRPRGAPTCCAVYLPAPIPPPPPRKELVVLRPDLDGKVGTVSVVSGDAQVLLQQENAAAEVMADRKVNPLQVSEADVTKTFGEALAALPIPPRSLTLFFQFGTVDLIADSKPLLDELRAELQKRAVAEVVVIGHTDRPGSVEANDRLSRQRAGEIRTWLIEQGVPAADISMAGLGEREPLVQTEDGVEELKNRRVEIRVR